MTNIRKTGDERALVRELVQRVENLERQNLLLHAAIDGLPGLAVKVPEGIHVKPGGSVAIEGDEGLDMKAGSSIKGDTNIKGGVDATGGIKSGGQVEGTSVKSLGDMNADGTVRGYAGVMMPIDGSMKQAGPQIEVARSVADTALANANSKPTKAYVDGADAALESRIDALENPIGGRDVTYNEFQDHVALFTQLKNFVQSFHGPVTG